MKTRYTLRELIFVNFADSDKKNIKNWFEEIFKMTLSTKINSGNVFIFFAEKKII